MNALCMVRGSPLCNAIAGGHVDCVEALLEAGATLTKYALKEAAYYLQDKSAEVLIQAGADVKEPSEIVITTVREFLKSSQKAKEAGRALRCLQVFLRAGACVNFGIPGLALFFTAFQQKQRPDKSQGYLLQLGNI